MYFYVSLGWSGKRLKGDKEKKRVRESSLSRVSGS